MGPYYNYDANREWIINIRIVTEWLAEACIFKNV